MDILYSTVAKWFKDGYENRDLNIFYLLVFGIIPSL